MKRLLPWFLRRSRGWPVPVPREPARPWAGQAPRVPPHFMTGSEFRAWEASQNRLPPVVIQGGQHGSVREARLAREASLRQTPPPPAEQQRALANTRPLSDPHQEAIRALKGRIPTYLEAVEIMGLSRRFEPLDPFVGIPGKHEIHWHGPGGVTVLRPEMCVTIKS